MVDKSVVIDFDVPPIIRNTMEDTEAAFEEGGELGTFTDWVDTLDNVCKECYVTGAITKAQWDTIMSRYPEGCIELLEDIGPLEKGKSSLGLSTANGCGPEIEAETRNRDTI